MKRKRLLQGVLPISLIVAMAVVVPFFTGCQAGTPAATPPPVTPPVTPGTPALPGGLSADEVQILGHLPDQQIGVEYPIGETINIGSNFEISMADVAKKVMLLVGTSKPIRQDDKRIRPVKSEVERLWCDNRKAKRMLGWEPSISFDKGLEKTIQWVTTHMNMYKANLYNV